MRIAGFILIMSICFACDKSDKTEPTLEGNWEMLSAICDNGEILHDLSNEAPYLDQYTFLSQSPNVSLTFHGDNYTFELSGTYTQSRHTNGIQTFDIVSPKMQMGYWGSNGNISTASPNELELLSLSHDRLEIDFYYLHSHNSPEGRITESATIEYSFRRAN